MLKHLDIARLVGAGIKCIACGSTHCHQTRWRSKHERLSAEGFRPYRCNDCGNRFLAAKGASTERYLINGTAAGLLAFAVLIGIEVWPSSLDEAATEGMAPSAMASADESQAGLQGPLAAAHQTADTNPEAGAEPEGVADKVELLRKAAEDGNAEAMVQLGRLLAAGNKTPKDVEQAANWMQLAAAMGNIQGMFELGRLYRDGTGVMRNAIRAYFWFSRAAAAHHADAMQERDELVRTMSHENLREAQKLLLPADWLDGSGRIVKK